MSGIRTHYSTLYGCRKRHLLIALALAGMTAAAAPLDPPTPQTVLEARRIVQGMIDNPRGPYSRIRWYCNDGTTQPPVAFACAEHGGGRQHAEYSAERRRLAELGWHVGTVFAALAPEELVAAGDRRQRLREIPLERYLIDIDDGWVLRRARDYRGRVQVENEVAAGRRILQALLADPDWSVENFLLVREAARSIPHGEDTDLARTVRRQAIQLAELHPAAERWRAEIHADPNAGTANRLRAWASRQDDDAVRAFAGELADNLDALYGMAGRRDRIDAALAHLRGSAAGGQFASAVRAAVADPPRERVHGLCRILADARASYLSALPERRRLGLLDAMQELDAEVQLAFQELADGPAWSREDLLALSASLLECAYASGLLSATELAAIVDNLSVDNTDTISLAHYRDAVGWLKRAPGWAIGAVRHAFAEPLIRYTALDPRAARFSDDLLRGSPMWMLGDTLRLLSRDVDALAGSVVEFDGSAVGAAVALNPGIGRGTLRVFETIDALEGASLDRGDIAVIPETIAELSPVSGILTLGEGNALSHVQLLARNFGIPNVAIDYEALDALAPLEGRRVLLLVTASGDVLLQPDTGTDARDAGPAPGTVTVPVPNLEQRELLVLDEIGRELSGRVVGPKAANLGELNRLFPGRVAPAVAIPFGVYAAHLDDAGLTPRIRAAFAGLAAGHMTRPEFDAELAEVRTAIASLELSAAFRETLITTLREQFGEPGSYGVFIRSDTNVEDLPQFTGAGLNETLPNIVALDAQIGGIPRVWSSVLSPRALAWRSSILANPDRIYASVLLMESVPATKSGVLVTRNLFDRDAPGLTASTAWGVGGAVAGEAAETIVIAEEDVEVYSEAKSPYRRRIAPQGGVDWVPAPAGRVLSAAEVQQLRRLAADVQERYEPVFDDDGDARPWDIEFGFLEGELTLFQIRPLVERGSGSADDLLAQLRPGRSAAGRGTAPVDLDAVPGD